MCPTRLRSAIVRHGDHRIEHGFTFRAESATRDYRHIGQNELLPPFSQQRLASYTYFSEGFGHFGLAYARVQPFDEEPVNTLSAN